MRNQPTALQYYNPVQPTVQSNAKGLRYDELRPDTRLKNVIYCYWKLQSERPLMAPYIYNVVADGCIDIFFNLIKPADNFAMGFSTANTQFMIGSEFHYAGIRFLPSAFPQIFRIDASELTNTFVDLETISPAVSKFIASRFDLSMSLFQIKKQSDSYFLKYTEATENRPDYRIALALDAILKNRGGISIKRDLDCGISQRHLRRLFKQYIGGTVKSFSKIVRFQYSLNRLTASHSSTFTPVLYDAGYYDQAHFIRDFKTFYGNTPALAKSKLHSDI